MLKDLPELIKAGIITEDTAHQIETFYQNKKGKSSDRLFAIFGVLGALLVGLGIILILAHNWDQLPRITKTIFAFLPLIIGQICCGFTLLKKKESVAWRESTATFLFFAVGANMALISQIYNIEGSLSAFLYGWMLLCLPLVYIMRSSFVSLLYIMGITYFAADVGYFTGKIAHPYIYWLLLAAVIPHYYLLYKNKPQSNFLTFHHWLIPLSITIVLGTVVGEQAFFLFLAYMSLFSLFYLIGNLPFFEKKQSNSYKVIGGLGIMGLLFFFSGAWIWEELSKETISFAEIVNSREFIFACVITVLAAILFFQQLNTKGLQKMKPMAPVFLLFFCFFILGMELPFLAFVLTNLLILAISVQSIIQGARNNNLRVLNYGLLIAAFLIMYRFFDIDLSFVTRGIVFVLIGISFFVANYKMFKKRENNG